MSLTDALADVLAAHVVAEWREVRPETSPGAADQRYGQFCSCGHMLDARDIDGSHRTHLVDALARVLPLSAATP